jgi:hypothetical protein
MVIAQAAPSEPDEHVEVLENGILNASYAGEVNSGNHLRRQTFAMSLRQTSVGKLPLETWICGSAREVHPCAFRKKS